LLNKILEAPVGQVANVLGKVLDGNILLQIIEQSTVSPHHFERKVAISSNQLPVIKAQVKFDSRQLPKFILDELLKKKQGIGSILTQNNISATRSVLSLNKDLGQSKTTREYQILVDGKVWFTIYEEIRLNNLGSSDNSRTTPR